MGSIKEKIKYIKETKKLIREAIIARGVDVPENTTFRDYANKIDEIPSGVDIGDYYDLTTKPNGGIRSYITQIPMLDTSDCTSMRYMFEDCTRLTTIPQIDTSKVINMDYMFDDCSSLTTIPQLYTSKVTIMSCMFYNCTSLTSIPQLDTSKVTIMQYMFYNCKLLTEIPQLDTSKVTNISNMFNGCSSLTTLGGFTNLGQAYETTQSANYGDYTLRLSSCTNLTHDSLMNVINNLYDIANKGVMPQQLVLGSTNISKLSAEEIQIATDKGFEIS